MSEDSTIDPVVPTDETVAPDAIPESSPAVVETQADAPEEQRSPSFQKRMNAVTAARREAEREVERLSARVRELEHPPAGIEPKLEDFPDWDTFHDARTQWKVDHAVTLGISRAEQRRTDETRQRESDRIDAEFFGKMTDQMRAKLNDRDLPFTPEMSVVIKAADNGVAVALYIADHPEEGMRIAMLPSHMQQFEIGRLSAALPKTTKPKPPPTPLTNLAGGSAATTPVANMSDAQFYKWRKAQIAERGNH